MECSYCGGFGWIEEPAPCVCDQESESCDCIPSYQEECSRCAGFGTIEILEALAG